MPRSDVMPRSGCAAKRCYAAERVRSEIIRRACPPGIVLNVGAAACISNSVHRIEYVLMHNVDNHIGN